MCQIQERLLAPDQALARNRACCFHVLLVGMPSPTQAQTGFIWTYPTDKRTDRCKPDYKTAPGPGNSPSLQGWFSSTNWLKHLIIYLFFKMKTAHWPQSWSSQNHCHLASAHTQNILWSRACCCTPAAIKQPAESNFYIASGPGLSCRDKNPTSIVAIFYLIDIRYRNNFPLSKEKTLCPPSPSFPPTLNKSKQLCTSWCLGRIEPVPSSVDCAVQMVPVLSVISSCLPTPCLNALWLVPGLEFFRKKMKKLWLAISYIQWEKRLKSWKIWCRGVIYIK